MSTIVVVRKGQQACIVADSLTTFGDTRQPAHYDAVSDKILRQGESLIGLVGSAAHQMVLQSAFHHLDHPDLNGREAIFETFRQLHPVLKDVYFLNPKDGEDDPYESSQVDALILNRGGIYGVYALREVFEYTRFWAIGSGANFALGAMHALYDQMDDPLAIARAAVAAAAEFDTGTALPLSEYTLVIQAGSTPKTVLV
ncbi:MAG: hypothetical protein ACFCUJ_09505 [Thiotrichales bacterium]